MIEKMIIKYPSLKYDDDINILSEDENKYLYGFFLPKISKSDRDQKIHYISGDYAFMDRWTEIGGEINLDVTIPITKTGFYSFQGDFLKSVQFERL